jgi:hypothetical protein
MDNTPEFLEKQKSFWTWFSGNESRFQDDDPEAPIFDELLDQLQMLDPRLYFMMSTESVPKEFVITTEGNMDLFPFVDLLVSSAPEISDWKVIGLKPPLGLATDTKFEDVHLKPAQMWFLPLDSRTDPHSLGLRIGAPGLDPDGKWAMAAVMTVLDSLLGERSVATDIQLVELALLPTKPSDEGYIEIADLPKYIAWRKKRLATRA